MNDYGNLVYYCCTIWVTLKSLFEKRGEWDNWLNIHSNKFLKTKLPPIIFIYLTALCHDDGRSMMIQVNQKLRKAQLSKRATCFCNTSKLETNSEWRQSHFSFLCSHHLSCQFPCCYCFSSHGGVCLISNRWRSLKGGFSITVDLIMVNGKKHSY